MRISGHTQDILEITFEIADVYAMLDKHDETLNEFAELLHKYKTWIQDVKKIRTRRLLKLGTDIENKINSQTLK